MIDPARTERSYQDPHAGATTLLIALLWGTTLAFSFLLTTFAVAKLAVLALGIPLLAAALPAPGDALRRGVRLYAPLWGTLALVLAVEALRGSPVPAYTAEAAAYYTLLLLAGALAAGAGLLRAPAAVLYAQLVLLSATAALLGLMQYLGWLEWVLPRFEGYAQALYSVFGNQDLLGGFCALGLVLLLDFIFLWRPVAEAAVARPSQTPPLGAGPWALRLLERRLVQATVLSVLLGSWLLAGSRTAWVAAAAGLLALHPWSRYAGRLRTVWPVLVLPGLLAAFVLITRGPALIARALHSFGAEDTGGRLRLWFWDAAVGMFAEAPFFGLGLGHFRYWSPVYQGAALLAPAGEQHAFNELHTLHAHSDTLELLAEAGLLGLAGLIWFLLRLYRGRRHAPTAWAGVCTLGVFALFNPLASSPPHALAALLLAGPLLASSARETNNHAPATDDPEPWRRRVGVAAVATLVAGFVLWSQVVPSFLQRAAEDRDVAGHDARAAYHRVTQYPWPQYDAWELLGWQELRAGDAAAAAEAFARARQGLDTGSVHLGTARAFEALGQEAQAAVHWRAALQRWPWHEGAWTALWAATVDAPDDDTEAAASRRALRLHHARWIAPGREPLQ